MIKTPISPDGTALGRLRAWPCHWRLRKTVGALLTYLSWIHVQHIHSVLGSALPHKQFCNMTRALILLVFDSLKKHASEVKPSVTHSLEAMELQEAWEVNPEAAKKQYKSGLRANP